MSFKNSIINSDGNEKHTEQPWWSFLTVKLTTSGINQNSSSCIYLWGNFLDWIIWDGTIFLPSRSHLLVAVTTTRKAFLFYFFVFMLSRKSFPSLVLKMISLQFWPILKTSWDILPHELNNNQNFGLSVGRLPLWESPDNTVEKGHTGKALLKEYSTSENRFPSGEIRM